MAKNNQLNLEVARQQERLKEFALTHEVEIDAPHPKRRFNALLEAMARKPSKGE